DRERGGADVDVQVNVRGGEQVDGVGIVQVMFGLFFVVPHVFADVEADAQSAEGHDGRRVAGVEVAILVEDVVRREEAFADFGGNLSPFEQNRGVVESFPDGIRVADWRADDHTDVGGKSYCEVGDCGFDGVDEAGGFEKVERRITADAEFRKYG